jgi:hypothetical protein
MTDAERVARVPSQSAIQITLSSSNCLLESAPPSQAKGCTDVEGFFRGLAAIVEVSSTRSGRLPVGLIRDAYRASRRGTVALVLNGVSPDEVDRALDPIVKEECDVAGVVYCTPATLSLLFELSGHANVARIGSKELRRWGRRRGRA